MSYIVGHFHLIECDVVDRLPHGVHQSSTSSDCSGNRTVRWLPTGLGYSCSPDTHASSMPVTGCSGSSGSPGLGSGSGSIRKVFSSEKADPSKLLSIACTVADGLTGRKMITGARPVFRISRDITCVKRARHSCNGPRNLFVKFDCRPYALYSAL